MHHRDPVDLLALFVVTRRPEPMVSAVVAVEGLIAHHSMPCL